MTEEFKEPQGNERLADVPPTTGAEGQTTKGAREQLGEAVKAAHAERARIEQMPFEERQKATFDRS